MQIKTELMVQELQTYCSFTSMEEVIISPKFDLTEEEKTFYKTSVNRILKGEEVQLGNNLWLIKDIDKRNFTHFACGAGNLSIIEQLQHEQFFD